MKRNLTKVALVCIGMIIIPLWAVAQVPKRSPHDLLRLETNNWGMILPAGPTLYAAIHEDGEMVYLERTSGQDVIKHKMLTAVQLEHVRTLLMAPGIRGMDKVLDAEPNQIPHRDFQTVLKLVLGNGAGSKSTILRGFYPPEGRSFPRDVQALLCTIDDLRGATYRLSSGCDVRGVP
jgi:hypothetical protein